MAKNSNNRNRGFADMDEEEQRAAASAGGKASSGKFGSSSRNVRKATKKGATARPTNAKRRGDQHSHYSE